MVQGRKDRQANALKRLNAQLAANTKPEKVNGKTTSKMVELSESDKKRINNEIKILEHS